MWEWLLGGALVLCPTLALLQRQLARRRARLAATVPLRARAYSWYTTGHRVAEDHAARCAGRCFLVTGLIADEREGKDNE